MRHLRIYGLAGVLALTGCGESTPADYEAEPDTVTMPTPSAAPVDEIDSDQGTTGVLAQGEWRAQPLDGNPAALFGRENADPTFSVRCDAGELVFVRSVAEKSEATEMTLIAGGETTRIPATTQTDPLPQVAARLGSNHPFAGTLAATSSPLTVTLAGAPALRMPASDIFRKVVSDCAT